jgi:MFS family permease
MAGSLGQLILFRVIQGLAGGGLQPSSQAVLLDAFPPEKQGVAMTLFGLAALLAPVVGPTLGGWLTDEYQWRWVFLINVPVGLLAFAGCYALLRDPDYLTEERVELRRRPFHFDSIGLSLLVIVMVCWEVFDALSDERPLAFQDPPLALRAHPVLFREAPIVGSKEGGRGIVGQFGILGGHLPVSLGSACRVLHPAKRFIHDDLLRMLLEGRPPAKALAGPSPTTPVPKMGTGSSFRGSAKGRRGCGRCGAGPPTPWAE